jgi:CDP-glycerol glycerophosphotransferase (TagB/SpsB family)
MLVRPHPIHDNAELLKTFERFAPNVKLQRTPNAGRKVSQRTQDKSEIIEWVNTFRHADVVINLSSTVTIDAALFNRPVINLDFDPQPGQFDQELIQDINHLWNHFQPVAESGGLTLVKDYDELAEAVKTYLKNPRLHEDARRRIPQFVCQYTDGKCAARMAIAIAKFAHAKAAEGICAEKNDNPAATEDRLPADLTNNLPSLNRVY